MDHWSGSCSLRLRDADIINVVGEIERSIRATRAEPLRLDLVINRRESTIDVARKADIDCDSHLQQKAADEN